MHTNVSFSKPTLTGAQREAEAFARTKQWLGPARMKTLRDYGIDAPPSLKHMYRQVRLMLCFAGVQGYWPARSIVRWMLAERLKEHSYRAALAAYEPVTRPRASYKLEAV